MIIFERLVLAIAVLFLLYLAFFSPKFDRFMNRLFSRKPDTADGIANKVRDIEAETAATKAALAARKKAIDDENDKLSKISVK